MFKVISAEFKKILAKPGIYILSVILAILLILGVFIYQPKVTNDNIIVLRGDTYTERKNNFMGSPSADTKSLIDDELTKTITLLNSYRTTSNGESLTIKTNIDKKILNFENAYRDYRACAVDNSTENYINTVARPKLINSLDELNETINDAMSNASTGCYALLTTEKNYKAYNNLYKEIRAHLSVVINDKRQILAHCASYEENYKTKLFETFDNFIYPNLSNEYIKDYTLNEEGTKLYILQARLNAILVEINDSNNTTPSIMDELANEYANTVYTYTNLVKYELLSNAFEYSDTKDTLDIMYIKSYSEYNCNSLLARYHYLFENNSFDTDYAKPLTIGVTSNNDINTYDYAYFVLRLFSFVLIIYSVMMACSTIAGELKEGSLRYYAIRPISRREILIGKFLSILILSTILLIFSSIIALMVGGVVYNFSTLNILTIFNGSTPIVIHPILMLTIFLISTIFEIIIYTSIALLLSCLLKSDLFAVTIMIVFYLINTLLPVFVNGANTWLAFYPFSHISIYSMFGSSVYAPPNDFFNMILGSKIYLGSNMILSSIMIILLIVLPLLLAKKVFKNKEL